MQTLSESTAIRLFNSVRAGSQGAAGQTTGPTNGQQTQKSLLSIHSANEFGNSCRICRYNRSDMQIVKCPCMCKGSVGFIHLQCLKRWIMHRRDNKCEICNAIYELPDEKIQLGKMLRTFMCARCCGAIVKHLLSGFSLVPLAHVILQQVLMAMESLNHSTNDQLSIREVLIASAALLTSSALFFHFFEYFTTRFMIVRNILRQWWMFGNTTDFSQIELETESLDLFF